MDATRDDDVIPPIETLVALCEKQRDLYAQLARGRPYTDLGKGQLAESRLWGWLASHLPELIADKARLDWMQDRVDGTGETMSFGGVCYWGVEIQKGQYGKRRRIGEGNDLREAVDDATEAAAHPSGERTGQEPTLMRKPS